MIFIKEQLNKDYYDKLNQLSPQELFVIGKIKGFYEGYFKCTKNFKKCAVKIINDKYYLIMIIEPTPSNSYVDTTEREDSKALQRFYEWADRVMENINYE